MDSLSIDIATEDERWAAFDVGTLADKAILVAANTLDGARLGELSLAFVDDKTIRTLNAQYRGKDKPTNVLSFPLPEGPLLGDIILAYETILAEASRDGKRAEDHISHLLVHGFLHLQGYDHVDEQEAERMEALEIEILKELGIQNPYIDHE